MDPRTLLTGHDVEAERLADWRLMINRLDARFETGDFATGLELVRQVGVVAEAMDHHPDVDLTYPRVDVRVSSHDVGGVTSRDVELARRISEIAASLGAAASPGQTSQLEIGLDTADDNAIRPFWAALLGYAESDRADEVVDPDGKGPSLWFQACEPHDTPHQRFHLDLRLPPEEVEPRIRRALDAGGTLVSSESAPAFWVLADADGNQCCLTTWQGRDPA